MAGVYAVIMAGGRGERFWPLSTDQQPKPFIPLLGATSLIEDTAARLLGLIPPERIFVSIGESHLKAATERLPRVPFDHFIVEPLGRDTSACLGFCALHLEKLDSEAVMLALPADHYISDPSAFMETITRGIQSLPGATGIVFGITPDRPDPAYGYVRAEKPAIRTDAWPVLRFIEKPSVRKAAEYLSTGQYFWNSGIFLFRNRTLLELFHRHMPETYRRLDSLRPLLRRADARDDIRSIFSGIERISIDFGILEKTTGLRLVPAEFVWDDIGNWASLTRALPVNSHGNVVSGPHVSVDTTGCVIYSTEDVVATLGVSNLVIIHANGKVLVCSKDRAPELKRIVSLVSAQSGKCAT